MALECRARAGASPEALEPFLRRAEVQARRRQASLPQPQFTAALPILDLKAQIVSAIERHPVIVVTGATGTGKSTQLPQLALAAGRGRRGYIGHTQPRRLAATTLALRIASELESPIGTAVGYKVRFRDRVAPAGVIKLLTDGMLLAETHSDPALLAYDTLILDEAHERNLNLDFLLGYIKRLFPQRPDLRVVITSATIEPGRFSRFFGDAPVIEVPGSSHAVEVRYRPPAPDVALEKAVADAVLSLALEGRSGVLAFLPGEREIHRTLRILSGRHRDIDVLPLYARLSSRDQERIFSNAHGKPRIVLATNIAETSLTVPDICSVVDTGLARIARYVPHAAIQRLPVEPISRASAEQRKGRAGRLAPGVCIRLYEEADFQERDAYTQPEILRVGLDGILLKMSALGLGDAERFPFLDPPDAKNVRAGYRDLVMLGALDAERRLTPLGKRLARLPLDPRLARILLAAVTLNALRETLTVVAALAVSDPRERPPDAIEEADAAHGRFHVAGSDFLTDLRLWEWYSEACLHMSRRALEAELRRRFLAPARMREWKAVRGELARLLAEEGEREQSSDGTAEALHRAVLAGFLDRVAVIVPGADRRAGSYLTARSRRVDIFPASVLARRRPHFIVAAELVETRRLYARHVAAVRPEWVEQAGAHLIKRVSDAPRWDPASRRAVADERVTLFGLVLVTGRTVALARYDRELAREIFIREALVGDRLSTASVGIAANRARIAILRERETRRRRHDLLGDPASLVEFYRDRIPGDVFDAASFERWVRRAERRERAILEAPDDVIAAPGDAKAEPEDFPETMQLGPLRLPVDYRFEPGTEGDGLTVRLPAPGLSQLDAVRAEWLVPGLLEEKIAALIRSLPKSRRRQFAPAAEFARALVGRLEFGAGSLSEAIAKELTRITGMVISSGDFRTETLLPHLRLRYEVTDAEGAVLVTGRDLDRLGARCGPAGTLTMSLSGVPADFAERCAVSRWDFGDLPASVTVDPATGLVGYPALSVENDRVALRLLPARDVALAAHRDGVIALVKSDARAQVRELRRSLAGFTPSALAVLGLERRALVEDLIDAVLADTIQVDELPYTACEYASCSERATGRLIPRARDLAERLDPVISAAALIVRRRGSLRAAAWEPSLRDVEHQLAGLFRAGFIRATPPEWRSRLAVYVAAMGKRLERLTEDPARDLSRLAVLTPLLQRFARLDAGANNRNACDARFALEELRIQLFAQELGTRGRTSPERVAKQLERLAV